MNPFKTKKGLGRGLSSLIGDSEIKSSDKKISISSIVPNRFQPRKIFDKISLDELTNSIKERGVIQPLIVRNLKEDKNKFELIAGERRLQASQNAGLHEVPVVIMEADDIKSLEFAIIENVQRQDLNPIEEAESYQKLIDDFNYDQDKVSKFIGKSRSHVANCLRILSLPEDVKSKILEGKLSQGHAKILVGLENASFLAKKIISTNLSVRQTEALINSIKKIKKDRPEKDINILGLEQNLKEKIGINVSINNNKNNTGKLIFDYKDLDQLNRLIMVIKTNY